MVVASIGRLLAAAAVGVGKETYPAGNGQATVKVCGAASPRESYGACGGWTMQEEVAATTGAFSVLI